MAYLDENGLEHFWGKIKGHVDSAVAPKADDADVVHKTGDATIEGVATFQNTASGHGAGETVTDLIIRNPEVKRGVPVEGGRSFTRVILADRDGDIEETFAGRLGLLEVVSPKENDTAGEELRLGCYKYSDSSADYDKYVGFRTGYDKDAIPFSTAPATSNERTESTDIVTRGYMEASEWNWQKTKKNAFVQFKSVPESDLEPVVDFMFTETPPAEGEKGPENPSTITGVSSVGVGRCGKNLFGQFPSSFTVGGVAVTVDSNGVFTLNGTCNVSATGQRQYVVRNSVLRNFYMPEGTFVALSMQGISGTSTKTASAAYSVRAQIETKPKAGSFGYNYVDADHLIAISGVYNRSINGVMIVVSEGSSFTDYKFKVQLEIGNTATSFETYSGNEYTISLGDTYYGGSLDVATGVMTETHSKIDLDNNTYLSSSIFEEYDNSYMVGFYPNGGRTKIEDVSQVGCSILPVVVNTEVTDTTYSYVYFPNTSNATSIRFVVTKSDLGIGSGENLDTVKAAVKAWFSQHPGVLVFPVANPVSTVQLTPTQIRSLPVLNKYESRINTVYTDQEAVQVGYQRYANYVDLTTNQTIDGQKTFVEQLFINTNSYTYQTGILSSQINGVRFSSEAFSVSSSGAYLDLNGRSAIYSTGCFILGANSSAGTKSLQGKPDGTLTWNGQTIQTTSDERLKTPLSEVPDAVLDAWEEVNWGQFQYLDAVKAKGESARFHLGLIAQHVMSVFEKHGLDACAYGILCHEERPAVDEEVTVVDAGAYVDEEGVEHPAVTHVEICHEDAVDLWMVRYAEAQAMEACRMRRENARLKKRVSDLEDRLAALELRLGSE